MTNILQLPYWVPTSIDETDERMIVHAVYTKKPDVCQVCGVVNASLYKHGQREITFLDTPIRKPTRIECHDRFNQEEATHHLSLSTE